MNCFLRPFQYIMRFFTRKKKRVVVSKNLINSSILGDIEDKISLGKDDLDRIAAFPGAKRMGNNNFQKAKNRLGESVILERRRSKINSPNTPYNIKGLNIYDEYSEAGSSTTSSNVLSSIRSAEEKIYGDLFHEEALKKKNTHLRRAPRQSTDKKNQYTDYSFIIDNYIDTSNKGNVSRDDENKRFNKLLKERMRSYIDSVGLADNQIEFTEHV